MSAIPEVRDVNVNNDDYVERENKLIQYRVEKAWKCILTQYQKMASDIASENGEGMCIFRFLPPRGVVQNESSFNCEFYWAEINSPPWKTMISGLGDEKEDLLKAYKPGENFMICIGVPLNNNADDYIQNIKLFDCVSSREVSW